MKVFNFNPLYIMHRFKINQYNMQNYFITVAVSLLLLKLFRLLFIQITHIDKTISNTLIFSIYLHRPSMHNLYYKEKISSYRRWQELGIFSLSNRKKKFFYSIMNRSESNQMQFV